MHGQEQAIHSGLQGSGSEPLGMASTLTLSDVVWGSLADFRGKVGSLQRDYHFAARFRRDQERSRCRAGRALLAISAGLGTESFEKSSDMKSALATWIQIHLVGVLTTALVEAGVFQGTHRQY
jgi:hypothetical protein